MTELYIDGQLAALPEGSTLRSPPRIRISPAVPITPWT